ncbi:MAG: signal peptide peptidase SppA [Candidatus Krumholzibacteriia bacterium]
MKKFWIVIVVLTVLIGGGLGSVWLLVRSLERSVSVDGGVLVWDVGGAFPEERDDSFWGQLQDGGELTLAETVLALDRAARDERVTALVMDLQGVQADWAKVDELARAVAAFRAAGKPVTAYLDGADTRGYVLAAHAGTVMMSPEATLMVLGVSAELDFMKDTLDKLGMEAEFIHVGRYKSAPERMTRREPSAANREMIEAIVADRWDVLLDQLAAARGRGRDEVAAWIDQGLFDAEAALAAGVVDTVGYWEDLIEDRYGDQDVTDFHDYCLDRPRGGGGPTVGLVYVTGVIMPGESRFDRFQGKLAGSETVIDHLAGMADDDKVRAVILRVDSPGGSALASDLIWKQIRRLQAAKPVIVSMSGMAASGGYYVSCPGDSVFADPGTLTGSIGVYAGKMDRSAMYRKIGINREFITRGENALLFSDATGFSDAQRALFTGQMERFYARFLQKVGDGRGLAVDEVDAVAQGRVWTGRQALARGLVDDLGGLHRALDSARWTLGLDRDDRLTLVSHGKELSLMERLLLQSLRDNVGVRAALAAVADGGWGALLADAGLPVPTLLAALRENGTLARVALMDGRPVAMAPFWLKVE